MTHVFTRIPLQAPVEVARNLIPNPSFEVDTSGFLSGGGAPVLARIARTVDPIGGAFLLRLTTTASGNADIDIYRPTGPDGTLAAVPGTSYTLSVVNGLTRAGRTLQLVMRFYDAGGTQLGANVASIAAAVVANTRYSVSTGPAPAGSVTIRPFLRFGGATASGEFIYLDQFALTATPALVDYFDGSTPGAYVPSYVHYAWTGSPSGSASVMQTAGITDAVAPGMVIAPWTAGRESSTIVHAGMDDPTFVRVTWRKPGPRSGEFRLLFDSASAANAAADSFFATSALFSYNGNGNGDLDIPQFCLTPGQEMTVGMADELVFGIATTDLVWSLTVPWTEIPT